MSIILDPNREGLEVFYNNKLRRLVGTPEECIDWVINISCEDLKDGYSDNVFPENIFKYNGKNWEQLSELYLDTIAIGRAYADVMDEIGIKFEKLDTKRVIL